MPSEMVFQQPVKAAFVTRLQPFRLPGRAARQLPDQSTTLWVESSSTGDPRLRGALPVSDICGAANWALLITSPQHPSLSRTRRDRLHRPFHNVVTNAKPHIRADAGR